MGGGGHRWLGGLRLPWVQMTVVWRQEWVCVEAGARLDDGGAEGLELRHGRGHRLADPPVHPVPGRLPHHPEPHPGQGLGRERLRRREGRLVGRRRGGGGGGVALVAAGDRREEDGGVLHRRGERAWGGGGWGRVSAGGWGRGGPMGGEAWEGGLLGGAPMTSRDEA